MHDSLTTSAWVSLITLQSPLPTLVAGSLGLGAGHNVPPPLCWYSFKVNMLFWIANILFQAKRRDM
jgi:hypothetical protein